MWQIATLRRLQGWRMWWVRKLLWQHCSQLSELSEHLGYAGDYRQQPEFMENAKRLFSFFGYEPNSFVGKTILDVGAGSKLKTKYFVGARIFALEPLADRFLAELAWSDLGDAERVYSQPVEVQIGGLRQNVDFVVCINVLDHVYSPEKALHNIYSYLKPDGEFFLSVDLHNVTHVGHPIRLTKSFVKDMLEHAGFKIIREHESLPYAEAYGEGRAYTVICRR
ncbi:MAG: class I SAM-dependent methyltransferase [Chloroflexi bacterium]|nr:class I SAM-dependent methyltransferase [Chloroflexota bacterium]